MTKAAVKRLFDAAWLSLLAAGCFGGLTFVMLATTLDRVEVWAVRKKILSEEADE